MNKSVDERLSKIEKFIEKQLYNNKTENINKQWNFRSSIKNNNERGHKPVCHNCDKIGHISKNCKYKKKKCFKCNNFGHISYYCRKNSQKLSHRKYTDKRSTRDNSDRENSTSIDIIRWNDINKLKSFLWTGQSTVMVPPNTLNYMTQNSSQTAFSQQVRY
jgi:hypothetical protein